MPSLKRQNNILPKSYRGFKIWCSKVRTCRIITAYTNFVWPHHVDELQYNNCTITIVFLQHPRTIAQNKSSHGTNQMWVVSEDAVLRVWFIHIHWYVWRYALNEVRDGRKQKLMLADRQVEPAKESCISSLPQPTWSHLNCVQSPV